MPTQKEIDEIKKDILEALEPKKSFRNSLVGGFMAILIANAMVNIVSEGT